MRVRYLSAEELRHAQGQATFHQVRSTVIASHGSQRGLLAKLDAAYMAGFDVAFVLLPESAKTTQDKMT